KGIAPPQSFNFRTMTYRPDIWYNSIDGLKLGANLSFDYIGDRHQLDLTTWYNSGILSDSVAPSKISYSFLYRHRVGKNAFFFWDTRFLDGIFYDRLGLDKSFGNNTLSLYYKSISMIKGGGAYWPYLESLNREEKTNSSINADLKHDYRYKNGHGVIKTQLRGNGLNKDYAYAHLAIEVINESRLGKLDLRTRCYFKHIEGSMIPEESMLTLASANMEE